MHILYTLIVFPVEQIIELCFLFVYRIFNSAGIAILGVSVAVSTLVLPVYLMADKQQRAEREKQAKMRGEIETIKAVFKGDKRHMLLSTLYRQNNYHPLYSLRGSLDLFIQIPFFIAAYHFLHGLVLLGGQRFLFISDLSAPDGLLYGINLLPVLMTLINCVSGAVYTKGFPLKDKLQLYGIAAVFLLLLYNAPAGLVLYWTSNNVYNLIKNILQKTGCAKKIIRITVIVFALSLMVFVLFFHTGVLKKRLLIAVVSLFLAGIPLWEKLFFPAAAMLKRQWTRTGFSFKADVKTFAFSCGILFLLSGLVIPSALIASSVEEFSFIDGYVHPFLLLQNVLLQSAGLFLVWGFFIYFLSDAKVKSLLPVPAALFTVLAVINTFAFKGDYGTITNLLELSKMESPGSTMSLVSTAVNIAAAAAILVLALIPQKILLHALLSVIFVSCLVFGSINTVKIYKIDSVADKTVIKNTAVVYPEPEYTFSQTGKNVLLIMLDRGFSGYVPALLEEKPELKDIFSGFVFYPNTVSFSGHTLMGSPPLYGGYEYTPFEMNKRDTVPLVDKHNEALLLLPRLFLDKGFTVSVSDPVLSNYQWLRDTHIFDSYPDVHATSILYSEKYINWWRWKNAYQIEEDIAAVKQALYNDLIRFSFFRIALPLFRKFVYDHGNYMEMNTRNDKVIPSTLVAYTALDVLPEITAVTKETISTYNAVYNDLPHMPAFLQFPDYDITQEVSDLGNGPYSDEKYYHVNIASWLLLAKWFMYLKENGVYDNTRIIIAADHGLRKDHNDSTIYTSVLPNGDYLQQYTPLLLFKDFNDEGALRTDTTFMTHADVPLLALTGIIDNPVNPFTGNPLKADKADGVTITTSYKWNPGLNGKFRFAIKPNEWLHVRDDIFDMKNWE